MAAVSWPTKRLEVHAKGYESSAALWGAAGGNLRLMIPGFRVHAGHAVFSCGVIDGHEFEGMA